MTVITLNSFWLSSRPEFFLLKRDTCPRSGDKHTVPEEGPGLKRDFQSLGGGRHQVYEGRFRLSGCGKSKVMQVRWLCGVSQGKL
jgi:hypothetical protein